MKWLAVKIFVDSIPPALMIEILTNTLYEMGIKGIEIEDPDEIPTEGWGEGTRYKPEQHSITVYIPENAEMPRVLKDLDDHLEDLRNMHSITLPAKTTPIHENDWAHAWKAFFYTQRVGKHLVIKPTWKNITPKRNDIVLELDPGMAFGTGTHPTTVLCLEQIEALTKAGNSFLDIGTGSGILMIAAAKLGANPILGVDNDPVAVDVAQKNLALNNVDPNIFKIRKGDLAHDIHTAFDLITANILSEVIIDLIPAVKEVLKPQGLFIASGIIQTNGDKVVEALNREGFGLIDQKEMDGWVALVAAVES